MSGDIQAGSVAMFWQDEAGYRRWLGAHPTGYVINCDRKPKDSYIMLHRATCETISGKPARGDTLTSPYMKVCAESRQALSDWAFDLLGTFPQRCGTCDP